MFRVLLLKDLLFLPWLISFSKDSLNNTDYNSIITNRSYGSNVKNKTQVVMNLIVVVVFLVLSVKYMLNKCQFIVH